MNKVVIAGYARTPIGDFLGSLSTVSAVELGVVAAKAALERSGIEPAQVEEVVAGMVYKAGCKGNPARQVQMKLGIPVEAYASTIDQQCASGMKALETASHQIMLGKTNISLVVGMESMSRVPHLLLGGRNGFKIGKVELEDGLLYDALHDAMLGYHMGITAENLATKYSITREEQDRIALLSHQRAVYSAAEGRFTDEIVPVEINNRKGSVFIDTDEHPRADISIESLGRLRPAFIKDGTVTAGNSSGINDGAAAVVLMSENMAKELGIEPRIVLEATTSVGVEPEIMGIGPAFAVPKILDIVSKSMNDIDYFEINEAFAAQFIAVNKELKIDMEKVNANGSGIALGHPVGCTGLRIIISVIQELKRRNSELGLASLCVGGGPSMAAIVSLN